LTRFGVGLGAGAEVIILIIVLTNRVLATIAVAENYEIPLEGLIK
jgi:hypothetical protein